MPSGTSYGVAPLGRIGRTIYGALSGSQAGSGGYRLPDDVTLKFGNDDDSTIKFTSADNLVDVAGANWRFAANQVLRLRSNTPGVNAITGLLRFDAGSSVDRPWIVWYDHTGTMRAGFGFHHTNFANSAVHAALEAKTDDGAGGFVTHLSLGSGATNVAAVMGSITGLGMSGADRTILELTHGMTVAGTSYQMLSLASRWDNTTNRNITLDIDPIANAGTESVQARMFRNTTTSHATVTFALCDGSGTNTQTIVMNAKLGRLTLNDALRFKAGTAFEGIFSHAASAARTWTFPDATGTVGLLGLAQTWSAVQSFSATPTMDAIAERTAAAGVTVDGLLFKDLSIGTAGGNLGFYGAAATARPAAYTQTYATATRTHAARTAAALTDSTGGAVSGTDTVAAIPDPADTPATADALRDDLVANTLPALRNAIATLVSMQNKSRTDDVNSAQVLNQVLDDLQLEGLLQ